MIAPLNGTAGLQVVIGTAPVHLLADPAAAINKPMLVYSKAEAIAAVGYSDDFASFTLCEAISASFAVVNVAPLVLINVLDPAKHSAEMEEKTVQINSGMAVVEETGVLLSTLVVKNGEETLTAEEDYTAVYNSDGTVSIVLIEGGKADGATNLTVSGKKVDASKVTAADIVGGVDAATGAETGLEVVRQVYPKLGMTPGILTAPRFSANATVSAALQAKTKEINGVFKCVCIADVDSGADGARKYQGAGNALKNRIAGSGIGQYFGSVFSSLGSFGNTLGNTKTGGFLSGLLGKAGGALGNLTMPLRQGIAGIGAAATIQGSIIQQNLSGLLGKAGGFVSGIANSGAGKAIGGVLGSLGTVAKSGAGVLGTVWGPIASGFGSIFAGAAPVIGVISSIIAVVSILGDHLEDIRGIIQNVFGDTGVAVFDKFMGVLQNVGSFITGLFADGGVANALAPLRETITNLFGEDAGAAFDGLTTILQSVMGVVGQIVSFAQTTVKPIIQDIFSFLTGTVVPIILQTFTAAAPSIAGIISGLGSAIMTAMQIIGSAIQAVMPIVQSIITVIMSIASVVVPAVLAGISALAQGIGPILEGIKTVFDGLIAFITGVFTGNWSQAWEGVKQIFGGAFDALVGLLKTPVNAVIALINKAISGINGLGLDIPDWVPIIGGKSFHISIPEIPMLAKGGFTDGVSIAGEAGREAVISFQRGVRAQNIATWAQAGRMLGVSAEQALSAADGAELKPIDPGEGGGGGGNFTFAPNIVIQGNADADVLEEALRRAKEEFEAWYEQMMRKRARTAY